jgi:DNA-binding response OmpR family regulator
MALAALEPDLLILDLRIGVDHAAAGPTHLHQRNAEPATAALPVLICSAATDLIDQVRPDLDRWSCAISPKPFDLDDLLAAVQGCLADSAPSAASA